MEISEYFELEDNTPFYNYHLKLGKSPSAAKFKQLFNTVYGSDTPPRSIRFLVKDVDGKVLFCIYRKDLNEVHFEFLTTRSLD